MHSWTSRSRLFDGENQAEIIAMCCGAKPAGHARWTLRRLAERAVELIIGHRPAATLPYHRGPSMYLLDQQESIAELFS